MPGFVGAQDEFHDAAFVQRWADRFVPTAPRLELFDLILEQLSRPVLPNAHVLELGVGPGYMALHDLGSPQAVADVYGRCYEILPKGGILVMAILPSRMVRNGATSRVVLRLISICNFFGGQVLRALHP